MHGIGDVVVVSLPNGKDDGALHGRRFKLLREERFLLPGTFEPTDSWIAVDVESGEERRFLLEHFDSMLTPEGTA